MNTEGMDIEQVIDALTALQAQDVRKVVVMPWGVSITEISAKMGEAIIETDGEIEDEDEDLDDDAEAHGCKKE